MNFMPNACDHVPYVKKKINDYKNLSEPHLTCSCKITWAVTKN